MENKTRKSSVDHKKKSKEYVCGHCNHKFRTLKNYRAHYKTHTSKSEVPTAGSELLKVESDSTVGSLGKTPIPGNEFITADPKPLINGNNGYSTNDHPQAKLHECPNCTETFKKIGSFRRHLRTHLDILAYSCKYCLTSFSTKLQLLSHIKQKCKSEGKKYTCALCKKKFYHRMGFMQHKAQHISSPPHKCPTCGALFPSLSKSIRHLAHHTVKCPICRKPLANDFGLWEHLNKIHPDVENCDVPCDTSEEEEDSDHPCDSFNEMYVESDADSYTSIGSDSSDNEEPKKSKTPVQKGLKKKNTDVCFICEQRFPNEIRLNSHMKLHQIYYCALCPKFFPHESKLKAHQSEHDQDKMFDDLLNSVQVQPTTTIPITNVPEVNSAVSNCGGSEKSYDIIEWYNSFNQLLENLQYPIGQDLILDINNYISELLSAMYNESLPQETRDTYKKIFQRLTGIIQKNGETLCP